MPAYIYAWIVISAIGAAAFSAARLAFGGLIETRRIDAYRNVFLALTAIAFLVHNYWIAMIVAGVVVLAIGAKEEARPALWASAIFALPAVRQSIPGFAGINELFVLSPVLVMTWAVLIPAMVSRSNKLNDLHRVRWADYCVIAYLAVVFPLSFRGVSATAGLKSWLDVFFSIAPVYFVFSRYDWRNDRLNALAVALVTQFLAIAVVAVLESLSQWHHYARAAANWGIDLRYVQFERAGFFRTYGPTFGSIVFGAYFIVAISFAAPLFTQMKQKALGVAGLGLLGVGLLSTASRGPWVAMVLSLGAKEVTAPRAITRLAVYGFAGIVALAVASVTPFGSRIISLLPIIGDSATETFSYRSELFRIGWPVAMETPLFGSTDYLEHPRMQALIQGQGFIDIVNAYLQIVLDYGLLGLGSYVLTICFSMWALWRSILTSTGVDPILREYMRAAFGCLVGLVLLFATTTQVVAQIEQVNWMLIGLSVGLARKGREAAAAAAVTAQSSPMEDQPEAATRAVAAGALDGPELDGPDTDSKASPPGDGEGGGRDPDRHPPHLRQYLRGRD